MHHCPSPGGSETPSIEIAERLSQWIIILYSKMDSSAGVPCRRAVFDIAQAHLMAKKRSNPRPGILGDVECVSNCYREPHATSFSSCADDEDWKLGRRGLNRAQQYALNGDLASALKLYELTIELLIRYLKSCAINNSNEKDHIASVEQTVQQTLSDAESIKARLATNAKPQPNTGPQRQCKSSSPDSLSSSSFRSLSKALMSALVGGASSQQLPQKQRPQQSSNWTNSHQQLIARPRPPATTIKPTNNTSTTDLTVGATTAARNSSSSSDALVVDTILSEFWVDPGRVQKTTWSDIAGLKACQQSLQESALLPLLRPDLCTGLRQPQHILLYGPPGTGKTLLVRAVAHESQSNLFVGTSVRICGDVGYNPKHFLPRSPDFL